MSKTYIAGKVLMSAQATTGIGSIQPFRVKDYDKLTVCIATSGTATLTVRCKGALGETAPTFTSAASATNPWGALQMIDLDDGSPVNGSTGVVVSGTDIVKLYEVNTNTIDWLAFDVVSRSAGSVTITITPAGSDV